MRLLIVDDDIVTVEVVKSGIAWQQLGITGVDTAYSKREALEKAHHAPPQLILCDIEMPGGSGIELLKEIREEKLPCEFIFLTCHESFDYASTAIEYGAIGYITKPFTPEKTIPVLTKAVNKLTLMEEDRAHRLNSHYWEENHTLVRENFWNELILRNGFTQPGTLQAELKKRSLALSEEDLYLPVLAAAIKSGLDPEQRSDFFFSMCNIGMELLQHNLESRDFVRYENDSTACVLFLVAGKTAGACEPDAKKLVDAVRQHLGYTVNCYIGVPVTLKQLYEERLRLDALCRNTLVREGQVICAAPGVQETAAAPVPLAGEQYTGWLLQGNHLAIVNDLKQQLSLLTATGGLARTSLEYIRQDYLQIIHLVLGQNGIQAHLLLEEPSVTELGRRAADSVFDFMKWANYITAQSIAVLRRSRSCSGVVSDAKRFVEEHYAEDISCTEIAASVFLTANHFSRLFRAETGEYINDYINGVRIRKAKELMLRTPDLRVGELAIRTGFASVSYFSTVFRKVTGQSPNEYKKSIQ